MNSSNSLKRVVLAAMLLALCVIGANVKIMGSVAFLPAPAFLGAILLGPIFGGFLGVFGHLVSAALAGFPLTLPIHLIIAVAMGICMLVFGWLRQRLGKETIKGVIIADIVGYAINVPIELVLMYPLLKQAVYVYFVPLTIATILNLIVCEIIYAALPKRVKEAPFLRLHS
ncbi:ECF transporter S component [Lentilactobacillus kisonensis]|uniref:ECF transporter S component n=1 Tax=Lentilactobacillus kisonensis F0435 TaxID=797516 RepID=H1LI25_9LACO|nr:ECF transporter S component [Lentilactobacillus kisonensis]EHO49978.1 hypothetical protein HMPREF9104_02266 [Lentilactobacillus kisonensis F0435]